MKIKLKYDLPVVNHELCGLLKDNEFEVLKVLKSCDRQKNDLYYVKDHMDEMTGVFANECEIIASTS